MARVTVEDCSEKIPNRFKLVQLAAQRAKAISRGAPITIDRNNDKNAVIALREIAEDKLDIPQLREDLIASLQTRNKVDIIEDENLHAESQETAIEEVDIVDGAMHLLSHEESLDLEIENFEDEVIDNEK